MALYCMEPTATRFERGAAVNKNVYYVYMCLLGITEMCIICVYLSKDIKIVYYIVCMLTKKCTMRVFLLKSVQCVFSYCKSTEMCIMCVCLLKIKRMSIIAYDEYCIRLKCMRTFSCAYGCLY